MDPKAQEIMEILSKRRECNIKTLDTIDTKKLIKLKTKNQHTFAQEGVALSEDEMSCGRTSSFSSGKASEPLGENDSSQEELRPPKITYISASLKIPKTARRTLNVDFRLDTTPGGEFNKLVFSLSDRRREFLANVPQQYHNDWEYTQALEYYYASTNPNIWIGKGRPRGRFLAGKHQNAKIQIGLSCVLEKSKDGYLANIWIEGMHQMLELKEVPNKNYPFRSDSGSSLEDVEVLPRRQGWK